MEFIDFININGSPEIVISFLETNGPVTYDEMIARIGLDQYLVNDAMHLLTHYNLVVSSMIRSGDIGQIYYHLSEHAYTFLDSGLTKLLDPALQDLNEAGKFFHSRRRWDIFHDYSFHGYYVTPLAVTIIEGFPVQRIRVKPSGHFTREIMMLLISSLSGSTSMTCFH